MLLCDVVCNIFKYCKHLEDCQRVEAVEENFNPRVSHHWQRTLLHPVPEARYRFKNAPSGDLEGDQKRWIHYLVCWFETRWRRLLGQIILLPLSPGHCQAHHPSPVSCHYTHSTNHSTDPGFYIFSLSMDGLDPSSANLCIGSQFWTNRKVFLCKYHSVKQFKENIVTLSKRAKVLTFPAGIDVSVRDGIRIFKSP